jgi:hypothetical protein
MREYIESGRTRTDHLKEVAAIIVDLRSHFVLENGRVDWSGRSPAYRAAVRAIYERGHVPSDKYDTVQAALRYHVGNLLRQRADADDLAAVGLSSISPKERNGRIRDVVRALAAGGSVAEVTGDPVRLIAHAEALLDFVDPLDLDRLAGPERAAARYGLRHLSALIAELEKHVAGKRRGGGGGAAKAAAART